MYGRGFGPVGRSDALYSLASILIFVWLLGAIGVFTAGGAAYVMLAAATVLVAAALFRRRV
jgi:hypothetical protein